MTAAAMNKGKNHHSFQGRTRVNSVSLLKYGRNTTDIIRARKKANMLNNTDSIKNWLTSSLRNDPTTFLNPISIARFADLAVERLIKFIQAMIRIKPATAPNIQTKRMSPWLSPSLIPADLR